MLQATSLLKTSLKAVSPASAGDFFCQVNLMTAFLVSTPSASTLCVGKSVKTRVIGILSLAFFAHGCKQHNESSFCSNYSPHLYSPGHANLQMSNQGSGGSANRA